MVDRVERKWVLWFALFVMLLTSVPYFIGYARQGEDWRFSGFVFGVEDGNSYIAKMSLGMHGEWLFKTPYTSYPQNGLFAFFPYLLLGKLAAAPAAHEQLVALFHIFRFVAGIVLIYVTYNFIALFIKNVADRRLSLVLITLGGGLGWLLMITGKPGWLGSLPLEYYSPETFGFLNLYGLPHISMARALLYYGLIGYLRPEEGHPVKSILRIGIPWLLVSLFQPLATVIPWFIVVIHILGCFGKNKLSSRHEGFDRIKIRKLIIRGGGAILISSPIVVYMILVNFLDPFFKAWSVQNLILSPHPLHYLVAYGAVVPLVVVGSIVSLRRDWYLNWTLVGWVICLPLLVYAPVNMQRRLADGVWAAIIILTIIGLEAIRGKLALWVRSGLFLLLLSSLILIYGGVNVVLNPSAPLFIPVDEALLYERISSHLTPGKVALASFDEGNALPAWLPLRVVIGHGPESVGLADLKPKVAAFYGAGMTDQERLVFIKQNQVDYILWGPAERALGNWDPYEADYLYLIDAQGDYQFYVMK